MRATLSRGEKIGNVQRKSFVNKRVLKGYEELIKELKGSENREKKNKKNVAGKIRIKI